MRVLACLWAGHDLPGYSGNRYGSPDVARLRDGLARHAPDARLTILADSTHAPRLEGVPGIEVLPFEGHGCGGWSHVLEAFRPSLRPEPGERWLLVGLDTIFTGPIDWLYAWDRSPVGLPLDPYHAPTPCDAVVTYNAEGAETVWQGYIQAKPSRMAFFRLNGQPSEMMLLRWLYEREGWEPLEPEPDKLLSYRVHVVEAGMDWRKASAVYWHGEPKPSDLPADHPLLNQ